MKMFSLQTARESAGFLLTAAIAAFIINLFHPNGYVPVSKESLMYNKIVFVDSGEAKIKFDAGVALFADSRSPQEFASSRISGSVNIPGVPDALSLKTIKENYSGISRMVELIIYCTGETCGSSELLARRIAGLGYSRTIYIMKDGLPGWENRGYPVDKLEKK